MKKINRAIICIAIPFLIIAGMLCFNPIVNFIRLSGPCSLYSLSGIYCPACGGTRSTAALINGQILVSLRYNIWVVLFCLLGILLYTEFVLKLFDIDIKIVPRRNAFIFTVLALFIIYSVARNFFPYLTPAI